MQKNTKIAPAPWRAEGWAGAIVNDAQGNTLTIMPGATKDTGLELVRATARLIAAAPDLLESLEEVLDQVRPYTHDDVSGRPWLSKAIAAIAKAKGGE